MSDEIVAASAEIAQNELVPSSAYRPLGLIGNPFVLSDPLAEPAVVLETRAQRHRLLAAIDQQADAPRPKVIWVEKAELPPSYALQAVASVEYEIVQDSSLNLVHAYIQLAMMRVGRIRAILQMVSERVAFGRFDKTVAAWTERVLAEPDTTLEAYVALGSERLAAFAEAYAADPLGATHEVFGLPVMERHMELTDVVDLRPVDLESEEIDESSEGLEIASDFKEARGVGDDAIEKWREQHELPEGEPEPESLDEAAQTAALNDAVFEYVFEYTREHLSPVVARALRAYRVRGVAVTATELTITKAPRKTLGSVLKFARCRFRQVVTIFDNFDAWPLADNELRSKIIGSLSEVRSLLGDDLEMVFLVERDLAPELEEQFGHGVRVSWDFGNLDSYFEDPEGLHPEWIDSWLASAALPGATPLTLNDPILSTLFDRAEGDIRRFATAAAAALDDAAGRGAFELDEQAERAGLRSIVESE